METVSVGGGTGGGAPHKGWIKPLNCRATSISVAGLRMMLVLRRMDTWRGVKRVEDSGGRGGRWKWTDINRSTILYKLLHRSDRLLKKESSLSALQNRQRKKKHRKQG